MTTNAQSRQIQSLVSYILDTKPYSRKLTDIGEEYRFTDYMSVNFRERLFSSTHQKGTWVYSQLSNGTSVPQPLTRIQRLIRPMFRKHNTNNRSDLSDGAFKAFRDENTDLPLVPFAFDPVALRGSGLVSSFVQRKGIKTSNEPLIEGLDVYLSHGAYVFQINQTTDAMSQFVPLYTDRRNHNLISAATAATQATAIDISNPASCVNRLKAEFTGLEAAIAASSFPSSTYSAVTTEINALKAVLNTPDLPSSYETLLNLMGQLGSAELVALGTSYSNLDAFQGLLESHSPSLYFNKWSDFDLREGGLLRYNEVSTAQLVVTNISANSSADQYQEWVLVAEDADTVQVIGSYSGYIGLAQVGSTFTSAYVTFTLAAGPDALTPDYKVKLTPAAGITIHPSAALEAWSLIKVNPLAYSRPYYDGDLYGFIKSLANVKNTITVLDPSIQTTDIIIEAISGTQFTVKMTADPLYSATAAVNTVFNDGRLGFIIQAGTEYTFKPGDRFYFHLVNETAKADDLDIYYGFDMGGYDAFESVYTNVNSSDADYLRELEFGYDSRFVDYDMGTFSLSVGEQSVNGRQYRLRAIPDTARPLLRVQRDSSTNNLLDETELDSSAVGTQYDMPNDQSAEGYWSGNDPDLDPDLELFYASNFALEYYDEGTETWVFVDQIAIGDSYSSIAHALSFTLAAGTKPFIGVILHSSWFADAEGGPLMQEDVEGGDVFYWTVSNPPISVEGSGLTSSRSAGLIMHGDSFQGTEEAHWTLTFITPSQYELQGTRPDGSTIYPTPVTVNLLTDGRSYRDDTAHVHFTVLTGEVGLGAGDVISFDTYANAPSYLVHGSVTGWAAPAVVGEWYFNGKIGFKLELPQGTMFEANQQLEESAENTWQTSLGPATLNYVRPDSPSNSYVFRGNENNRWVMFRNGQMVASGITTLSDEWLSITLPFATFGASLMLSIGADDRSLSIGRDLAIVKTGDGRSPTADDFCLFERTPREDSIGLFIKPLNSQHNLALGPLDQVAVDQRFIDLNTNGAPISNTSPETEYINGWVPMFANYRNGAVAQVFPDPVTDIDLTSVATGETIGTVKKLSDEYYFEWNTDFFDAYMPLNAEAKIVSYGSGMFENVNVNFSETLNVLIGGGGLAESFLFNEQVNVQIQQVLGTPGLPDVPFLKVKSTYEEAASATIEDGPFNGFMPGYDTLPFDAEDGVDGYYDVGQPLVSAFERAQDLAALTSPTQAEQDEFDVLYSLIQPYLENGVLADTTLSEFMANLEADDSINYDTTQDQTFGVSAKGLAVDVAQQPSLEAGASIVEAMAIQITEYGSAFSDYGFDVIDYDVQADSLVHLNVNGVPPIPSTGMPGGTYSAYETDLEGYGRVIRVGFVNALTSTPTFYIWIEGNSAPTRVNVVNILDNRTYEFSVPQPVNFKLVVL